MNAFQQMKAKELQNMGWTEQGRKHHKTGRDRVVTYMYTYTNSLGLICYLAPSYIQYIKPQK
mgnify:CR=1 FL=1